MAVLQLMCRDLLFIKGKGLLQLPESLSADATKNRSIFQDTGYSTASKDSQILHINRVGQSVEYPYLPLNKKSFLSGIKSLSSSTAAETRGLENLSKIPSDNSKDREEDLDSGNEYR